MINVQDEDMKSHVLFGDAHSVVEQNDSDNDIAMDIDDIASHAAREINHDLAQEMVAHRSDGIKTKNAPTDVIPTHHEPQPSTEESTSVARPNGAECQDGMGTTLNVDSSSPGRIANRRSRPA